MTTQLQSPPVESRPSGRRAGATWVAATGAFLLLAGAAVFVAVRWDELSEMAKLLIVSGITGACLAGGRALRRPLPSTGDVLFHLGAFLLPVDLAAVALRTGTGWRTLLLAEGALGCAALGGLGLATGSVVLTWAGVASVVVLAAGLAAVTPVPAALSLAVVAVAAEVTCRSWSNLSPSTARDPGSPVGRLTNATAVWATVAGLAPVVAAAVGVLRPLGQGTLAELGLNSAGAAAASSILAAAVLAHQAHRRSDIARALLAMASLAVGAVATFVSAGFAGQDSPLALAGAFVIIELAVVCLRSDPFWSRPASKVADAVEAVAMVGSLLAGLWLVAAPFDAISRDSLAAAALALTATGWLIADLRRYQGTPRPFLGTLVRGGSWPVAAIPLAITTSVAVGLATGSAVATSAAMVVVCALLTVTGRPGSSFVTAAVVPWALVSCLGHPAAAPVIGILGALVAAEAAVCRRLFDDDLEGAAGLAVIGLGTGLAGLYAGVPVTGLAAAIFAAIPLSWLIALQLDRGSGPDERLVLGDLGRGALAAPLIGTFALEPGYGIAVAAIVGAVLVLDALRLDRPDVAFGAALASHVLVAQLAAACNLGIDGTGLALCVSAVAWAGLAAVVDAKWRLPFLVAAVTGVAVGLTAASNEPATFATAGLIAGGLGIAAGVISRRPELAHAGGMACTLAIAGHLSLREVTAGEPYILPVVLHLLVVGGMARSSRAQTSSWVAYAPAVALLGATALSERLVGGPGWHAVVAGAVGVTAVAAGGWLRLAGPLMVGTGLLVTVTVLESMSTLAGVPTWFWLGTGGAILLSAGIAMERADTSPIEAGRRLVDVVDERFT